MLTIEKDHCFDCLFHLLLSNSPWTALYSINLTCVESFAPLRKSRHKKWTYNYQYTYMNQAIEPFIALVSITCNRVLHKDNILCPEYLAAEIPIAKV